MEYNAKNSDGAAYILMGDQRRNVTWGAKMTVCHSASQLALPIVKELEMICEACCGFRPGKQVVSIFNSLMFYLLTFCHAGCRPGHALPLELLSAATEKGVRYLVAAQQHQPQCMCVLWLHPFSLPHKIYKSSRHIKAVLGSWGWGTDGRGMKRLGCCC